MGTGAWYQHERTCSHFTDSIWHFGCVALEYKGIVCLNTSPVLFSGLEGSLEYRLIRMRVYLETYGQTDRICVRDNWVCEMRPVRKL
jgi:hypothetical protein